MITTTRIFLTSLILFASAASTQAQMFVGIAGDTLLILGTNSDDDVRVRTNNNGTFEVRANGQTTDFSPTGINQIFFEGSAGDDRFRADVGVLSIANGGSGRDRLLTVDGPATFDGGAGRDHVIGGPSDDFLAGGSGDDDLFGNGGNDAIFGGSGEDLIYGGNGDDVIGGGTQDDLVFGQAGADRISGDNGDDRLFGSSGDDNIDGGRGEDELFGSSGDDVLNGSNGEDELFGGGGNDVLCGGENDDKLVGSSGDDELFGGAGIDDLNGGTGTNVLNEDGASPCDPPNFVGGLTDVCALVVFPGAQGIDGNGNGVVDPDDEFEFDVEFTAGANGATGVSFSNLSVIGPGQRVGVFGGSAGNLGPNQTTAVIQRNGADACITVDANAGPGDQIFAEFDVTAGGQTQTVMVGPFTVGQLTDGQKISAAPVN